MSSLGSERTSSPSPVIIEESDDPAEDSEIISLNVGGKIYYTTRQTLCKQKDSMLYAMFSGRYKMTKDNQGHYFIDRDGKTFRYILNYLRSSQIPEGLSLNERKLLQMEADYFGISALSNLNVEKEEKLMQYFALKYDNHYGTYTFQDPAKVIQIKHNMPIQDALNEIANHGWHLVSSTCTTIGSFVTYDYTFARSSNEQK